MSKDLLTRIFMRLKKQIQGGRLPFLMLVSISMSILSRNWAQNYSPTFEDIISLPTLSNPQISPDGLMIIFEKQRTNWEDNKFHRELWISKPGIVPFQLTNSEHGCRHARWSPDGKYIGYLTKRGEMQQIHVMSSQGGAAFTFTDEPTDITTFSWSPDGTKIAFIRTEDLSERNESRDDKYGAFAIEDAEFAQRQIWIQKFDPTFLGQYLLPEQMDDSLFMQSRKAELLMDSADFSVVNFKWSPDGKTIAFTHQPNPLINSFFDADIAIFEFETNAYRPIVAHRSYDGLIDWSPDGQSLLYQSHLDDTTSNYYLNNKLFVINIDQSGERQLAIDFDEDLSQVRWTPKGISALAWQKTQRKVLHIDPNSGDFEILRGSVDFVFDHAYSKNGQKMVFLGRDNDHRNQLYRSDWDMHDPVSIFNTNAEIDQWQVANSEVINWQSTDGSTIEGILDKPHDFDPQKKYPLFVVIHGGPTGISLPDPVPAYVYPIVQWLNKGALVLRPNYRGSAGYGEAFRSLNVKNLGVGDAWDVLSGVRHLEDAGLIDGEKVACMGWSQGGYISAFLATNSDKFKAISVGAGISNWMTYYVNTDIHPFTRQYLKETPWADPEIYARTSPMTNINQATTPTLIQHGEFDRRVPVANAYELFQGLQDVGVPSQLIIYKGFGHGITKPRERLAAMWHNWQWFAKYIWHEEVEIPE